MGFNFPYKTLVFYIINVSFFLYILALFGINMLAPKYLNLMREFLKFYIGLLLIIFYNPYIKIYKKIDNDDKRLFFNSGILLVLSSIFYTYIERKMKAFNENINLNLADDFSLFIN